MAGSECLVLIPAFNEEQNVGKVLKDIRKSYRNLDVLVINDGSHDQTALVVDEAGEKVITLPFNLGYGGALQTGFKFAEMMNYRYVIQFDADGQHDPGDITLILKELRTGNVDIVIGTRFMGRSEFVPGFFKKSAIKLFRFLIRCSTGEKVTDPTSGLQGLSRAVFVHYAKTGNFPEDFPDADTLINSILSGFRVREIPANIRYRHAGESMHGGLKTAFYMIKMVISISVVVTRKKLGRE